MHTGLVQTQRCPHLDPRRHCRGPCGPIADRRGRSGRHPQQPQPAADGKRRLLARARQDLVEGAGPARAALQGPRGGVLGRAHHRRRAVLVCGGCRGPRLRPSRGLVALPQRQRVRASARDLRHLLVSLRRLAAPPAMPGHPVPPERVVEFSRRSRVCLAQVLPRLLWPQHINVTRAAVKAKAVPLTNASAASAASPVALACTEGGARRKWRFRRPQGDCTPGSWGAGGCCP